MITAIVLLILFCAPCLLGASAGWRFERTLPLATMGMAALLFLSGMTGNLAIGFCIILLLSAGALVFSAVRATRMKTWKDTLSRFFTSSFFIFTAAAAVITYCYYGTVSYNQDEMSHWLFVVKAMTYLDDFGTSPDAPGMWYASYPPGMALMQYLTAKLDTVLRPGREFTDWLSYYTYHVFSVSVLLPLSSCSGLRQWWKKAVYTVFMLTLSATVFRQEIFTILIDPFVGLVTGIGFLAVLFTEKKDALYRAYMCLLCATLVLSKDIGMAAGMAVAVVYMSDELGSSGILKHRNPADAPRKAAAPCLLAAAGPLASGLCAKALWALELHTSNVSIKFGSKVDYLYYAKIFFFGGDETYYQWVADTYKDELLRGSFFSFHGLNISIGAVFAGCCIVMAILFAVLKRTGKSIRLMITETAAALLYCSLYIFNMGAVYIYRFFDYEALGLASLWRYVGMALLPVIMMTAALGIYTAEKAAVKLAARGKADAAPVKRAVLRHGLTGAVYSLLVIAIIVLSLSSEAVREVVTRRSVAASHQYLSCYVPIAERIKSECTVGDRIYVIIQGKDNVHTDGLYDNMAVRMMVYPIYIEDHAHTIGKTEDGEYPREDIPADQWLDNILENYDYVAVYKPDAQLESIYGEAFENGGNISPGSLYKVNRESRMLELVP